MPVKYLDEGYFPNGNLMQTLGRPVSRYVVEETTEETFERVTYTLATPIDCDNAIIPARTILADVCQWRNIAALGVDMTGRQLQMSAIIQPQARRR